MTLNNINYLFNSVTKLRGVGPKLASYLKNKKIKKIKDLIWHFPFSETDRSNFTGLDNLEIGMIQTLKVKVKKYNFPRLRNLPNRIICENDERKIELVYFNSKEPYLKKILKIGTWVVVSGKIGFYKNNYQIINPSYVTSPDKIDYVKKIIPKYSLTEGLNDKVYRKIIEKLVENLPNLSEWHDKNTIEELSLPKWKESIKYLHSSSQHNNFKSKYFKRIAFDEIFSNLIILSNNRSKIKRIIKQPKIIDNKLFERIKKNIKFDLTDDQLLALKEINKDLISNKKMFRLLQGDVGCGKTIVSLIAAGNVVNDNYQCGLMAPTDILAKQHYETAINLFKDINIKIGYLSGKLLTKEKKIIKEKLINGEIDILIGTHSLFYEGIKFKRLGLVIIDEQHRFGVEQRMMLSKKGGNECDTLLMSATPIPRTIMLTFYGDLDVTKIINKPNFRKKILTIAKPEKKINEIYRFLKDQIQKDNQIFWVCPLITDSKILNFTSVEKRFKEINKIFPNKTGLIHGNLKKGEKDKILKDFLKKKIKIIVSTTVIEVGVDFPNANLIVIENSEKFGLAQLHQLRGRVGRGSKQGICILLYKNKLTENSTKRLKILKSNDNGFTIAEEDMKLRGYGDLIGYQQSGEKFFKIAKPEFHSDLFDYAEKKIKELNHSIIDLHKYELLLKLFDKAELINSDNNN